MEIIQVHTHLDCKTRDQLAAIYEPYNKMLYDLMKKPGKPADEPQFQNFPDPLKYECTGPRFSPENSAPSSPKSNSKAMTKATTKASTKATTKAKTKPGRKSLSHHVAAASASVAAAARTVANMFLPVKRPIATSMSSGGPTVLLIGSQQAS